VTQLTATTDIPKARKQVGITPEDIDRLKGIARSYGWSLSKLHARVLLDFIAARSALEDDARTTFYLASPKASQLKVLNVIVPEDLMQKVTTIAEYDAVTLPRCLYTAFMRFLQQSANTA